MRSRIEARVSMSKSDAMDHTPRRRRGYPDRRPSSDVDAARLPIPELDRLQGAPVDVLGLARAFEDEHAVVGARDVVAVLQLDREAFAQHDARAAPAARLDAEDVAEGNAVLRVVVLALEQLEIPCLVEVVDDPTAEGPLVALHGAEQLVPASVIGIARAGLGSWLEGDLVEIRPADLHRADAGLVHDDAAVLAVHVVGADHVQLL